MQDWYYGARKRPVGRQSRGISARICGAVGVEKFRVGYGKAQAEACVTRLVGYGKAQAEACVTRLVGYGKAQPVLPGWSGTARHRLKPVLPG